MNPNENNDLTNGQNTRFNAIMTINTVLSESIYQSEERDLLTEFYETFLQCLDETVIENVEMQGNILVNLAKVIDIFPEDFITQSNIISELSNIISNNFKMKYVKYFIEVLITLISKSETAFNLFCNENSTDILTRLTSSNDLFLFSLIYKILLTLSTNESGVMIIYDSLIPYIIDSISKLVNINEFTELSQTQRISLETLLNTLTNFIRNCSVDIDQFTALIIRIVESVYVFPYSSDFAKFATLVLIEISKKGYSYLIIENHIQNQLLEMLNDCVFRKAYPYFISLLAHVSADDALCDILINEDQLNISRLIEILIENADDLSLVDGILTLFINFTSHQSEQIANCITDEFISNLFIMAEESSLDIRKSSCVLLWNIINAINNERIHNLLTNEGIDNLINILECDDTEFVCQLIQNGIQPFIEKVVVNWNLFNDPYVSVIQGIAQALIELRECENTNIIKSTDEIMMILETNDFSI